MSDQYPTTSKDALYAAAQAELIKELETVLLQVPDAAKRAILENKQGFFFKWPLNKNITNDTPIFKEFVAKFLKNNDAIVSVIKDTARFDGSYKSCIYFELKLLVEAPAKKPSLLRRTFSAVAALLPGSKKTDTPDTSQESSHLSGSDITAKLAEALLQKLNEQIPQIKNDALRQTSHTIKMDFEAVIQLAIGEVSAQSYFGIYLNKIETLTRGIDEFNRISPALPEDIETLSSLLNVTKGHTSSFKNKITAATSDIARANLSIIRAVALANS